jgi:phosphinothricin acetyltransferase
MAGTNLRVRDAVEADGRPCAEIYDPYVQETAITFESDPPGPAEMAARIAAASRSHAWLVLEIDDRVTGYAYAGAFRSRAAYRWSAEVSVYLERGFERRGGGRTLYQALFRRLAERGFRTAVAGMTIPNDASIGLHRSMGFEPVGTYRAIGWKLGAWHDVAWMQRTLTTAAGPPAELR